MQMAIDEMEKSIHEPRADGKINPKVGAVLIKPDGSVETAHRGELRYGDHAEFGLIERKNRSNVLDGSVLYTTLEPCAPGSRQHPKLSCAERIVNARVKQVWIGVEDPFPTVAGNGIAFLQEHDIDIQMFEPEFQSQIHDVDAQFFEYAKLEAANKDVQPRPDILKDVASAMDSKSLSGTALKKFIDESGLEMAPDSSEFQHFLTNIGVMRLDVNVYRPTGLGILLFGKNPRAKFPGASFKASVVYGDGKVESKSFDEALVLLPDRIEEWLKKVLPGSKDTSSFKRKDITGFPIGVLREAVINAVVHRDYEITGAKSSVEIDSSKIVIRSPGMPISPITLEQLNTFKAPSLSRNPVISYVFNLLGYVEESGFGMRTMRSLNTTYKLPLPIFSFDEPFLTATFARSQESAQHIEGADQLTRHEFEGLEFIRLNSPVSRRQFQEALAITNAKAAERQLGKMVDLNLIRRKGAGRAVIYEFIAT